MNEPEAKKRHLSEKNGGGLAPSGRWDRIYLSPHLDDAVFSCGGRIQVETGRGLRVLVATVATADAPDRPSRLARLFHRRSGLGADATARRREEDRRATARLGAEALHLGLADAVYRRRPGSQKPLYPNLAAILGRPRAGDPLARLLAERLSELPDCGQLLVPLAIGGHVDHRITRAVAEALRPRRPCCYWEDFPYAVLWPSFGRRRPPAGWRETVFGLPPEAIEARCRAMAAYRSQVPMIFGSEAKMRRRVLRSVRRRGGERYWLPAGEESPAGSGWSSASISA